MRAWHLGRLAFNRLSGARFLPSWRDVLFGPGRLLAVLGDSMPKGLYARSLLIIITPIVILQAVVAYVFMEKHWQSVHEPSVGRHNQGHRCDHRISTSSSRTIPAPRRSWRISPRPNWASASSFARSKTCRHAGRGPSSTFSIRPCPEEITQRIGKPFWIDTVGRSDLVEVRVKLDDTVLRVFARRSQTYASNSYIVILWMIGSSLILMTVAILFLRNQIRPIQQLAIAAQDFGKGRDVQNFRPRGAREVRQAANAFIEMRRRVERSFEQRTTMLNGVSHDMRTILDAFQTVARAAG